MKRKMLVFILVGTMALSATACGNTKNRNAVSAQSENINSAEGKNIGIERQKAEVQNTHITEDTLLLDIMNHPAFEGYGQFLFARITPENAGTRSLKDLNTEYAYNDPKISTDVINEMIDASNEGKLVFYDIYSEEEKAKDPTKEDTGLFFFQGGKNEPFAVINAGGAFAYVSSLQESFPHALALSNLGYNAFTLQYRTGMGAETAYEDLARALTFIFENADELGISTENYSLWGASAGARMAASLGSYGTEAYGEDALPRPATVIMEYTGYTDYTENDPPTYAVVGEDDGIANWQTMQERLNNISAQGIDTEFHVYHNLGHGFGLGLGTTAEEWFDDAVKFWESHMQ